jgi:hypothetical protein
MFFIVSYSRDMSRMCIMIVTHFKFHKEKRTSIKPAKLKEVGQNQGNTMDFHRKPEKSIVHKKLGYQNRARMRFYLFDNAL